MSGKTKTVFIIVGLILIVELVALACFMARPPKASFAAPSGRSDIPPIHDTVYVAPEQDSDTDGESEDVVETADWYWGGWDGGETGWDDGETGWDGGWYEEAASGIPYDAQVYEANFGPIEDGYYGDGSGVLTMSGGVNYYNGRKETWYSQRVLPGGGLDIPGRHVADDGTIRDEDGYICVAASDLEYGTIVETSLGTGKVYDCGCEPGTTDIYVDW